MDIGFHAQFWLTIVLCVASLVILLARGRSRGRSWLIGFLVLHSSTYAGYYVPSLLALVKILPREWHLAYITFANFVLPVTGAISWVFLLMYVVVHRSSSQESIAVSEALVTPPLVMREFKCTTCGQEWGSNYCPRCCRTINRSADAKTADTSSGSNQIRNAGPMNAEADDKQKPVESSQRSTESRAGAETESNNSPPQSFTGVPSIWKFLGTVAIAGGALAAIAGFIQTVGYQARPDATLAIVVGIVSIGFGIFLRTLR